VNGGKTRETEFRLFPDRVHRGQLNNEFNERNGHTQQRNNSIAFDYEFVPTTNSKIETTTTRKTPG